MYQFIFSKKFKWFCFIIWICHKISEVSIASHNPHIGCVRNARTCSPFSLQPQPTACVPCSAHLTDGFKGRLKKRSRRLFHLPCDKRLPEKFLLLMFRAFFFRRPATLESAVTCSLPRGGGLGRGYSPSCGNFSQHPNRPNTNLAVCCPLSNSLPLERGRGGC